MIRAGARTHHHTEFCFNLAKKADIKYTTLIKVESGAVNKPNVQTMTKIAKALGVSVEDLIK